MSVCANLYKHIVLEERETVCPNTGTKSFGVSGCFYKYIVPTGLGVGGKRPLCHD